MVMGTPIATGSLTTSTAESANQVQSTYDYVDAGTMHLYAKASALTVLASLFVGGKQILRNLLVPFSGTAGTLDTSANYMGGGGTLGGRVELTFRATAATPTVDFILTYQGIPLAGVLSRFAGRR